MKTIRGKYRCPNCNHKFLKCGIAVSSNLRFCVCDNCGSGIWIDIKTGKDSYGRIYSTDKYKYCKCKVPKLIILSNPVKCEHCNKMIHIQRLKYIRKQK
jgi:hypothetical protein